jgi:hypothetical protein
MRCLGLLRRRLEAADAPGHPAESRD